MSYYVNRFVSMPFDEAIETVTRELKNEGFGVLTEIDVQATIKAKLGADFRPYRILGACKPTLAHQALEAEDKIGLMLPCNLIVQQWPDGRVEVAAIDPVASMQAVGNEALVPIGEAVRTQLARVLDRL